MKNLTIFYRFHKGKGLLIAGFAIVILLILVPLIVPRFLKPDPISIGLLPGLDALPFQLGVDKPVFLENRLLLRIMPFEDAEERNQAFLHGNVDIVLCDLPSAILLTAEGAQGQIIRTVLRSNPLRPLYAIFGNYASLQEQTALPKDRDESETLVVPKGLGFSYLADRLRQELAGERSLKTIGVESNAEAIGMLRARESTRALLRLPFTTLAEKEGFINLADDREELTGMSVLVISLPLSQTKPQVLKRFLYAVEQTILELNYRPDQYNNLLEEKGMLPEAIKKRFPMPIYEGPNVPTESEMEKAEAWLMQKGYLSRRSDYKKMVNLRFLPDPDRVARAACCL